MLNRLNTIHEAILRVFKEAGVGVSLSKDEIDARLPPELRGQSDMPRRIRDLRSRTRLPIPNHKADGESFYTLMSLEPEGEAADSTPISGKLRAKVLLKANGRCLLCGATIAKDGVKLVADHRVPREWGGPTEEDNLWAICETCNIQKRDYFATLPQDIMKRCMVYDDSVLRLGELLMAKVGVPGETGANRFSYRCDSYEPCPDDVRAAIQESAKKRGAKSL